MIKLKLFFILILLFLIFQTVKGDSSKKIVDFEINTTFGSFPLSIPAIRLPKYKILPLITVPVVNLPDIQDWHDPRYIPESPSWLDQAGKFYKEGIEKLFTGELNLALKRFKSVIDEFPESVWYYQSFFWYGQLFVKQGKFEQAEKTLTFYISTPEAKNKYEFYTDYRNFTLYTLVWLALKQKKYEKALILIEKYEPEINVKKLQNKLHYLKYYTYKKLNNSSALIFTLLDHGIQKFPFTFEHIVRFAEHYYRVGSWKELSDFVTAQSKRNFFYNDPQMEYFLWLGVIAEIRLKKWHQARKKLNSLEKLGVQNRDKLTRAHLILYLEENNFLSAWRKWIEIEDDILREQYLRKIIHYAIKNYDFNFLQNKLTELKSIDQYWRTWQSELELIYAYVYLSLGQRKKARQWLQWSLNHSRGSRDESKVLVFEESLFLRSVIELISFEYKKAFLSFKKLLENYPSSVRLSDYYFWYGVMLYETEKKHMDVIMALRQVEQDGERDDDRWYLLGKINHDHQKWRPAIFSFSSLIKKHPTSRFIEESLYLQADSYYQQKRYNSGLETLNDLQKDFPSLKKPVRAIHLKVMILLALKKFEQADDILRRRIASKAELSLIKLRVEVLKHIKDPKRILSVTGEGLGISTNEDQGFLYFHRANALYDMQKFQEADAYYNLAIKNPPKGSKRFISFQILKIQYVLERIPELLKGLEKFLKVNPDDDYSNEILFLVGNYFLNKNKKEKASPYFNKLLINYKKSVRRIELSPENRLEQIFLIGKLYKWLENYEMAERWMNQALKSMETLKKGRKRWHLSILREKGEILFFLGKHRQALAASLKVLYLDNAMTELQTYNLNLRIASSYVQLDRIVEAQAIYQKILKKLKNKKRRLEVEKLLKSLSKREKK